MSEMSKFYFPLLTFLLACLNLFGDIAEKKPRPNIIFIMADDHTSQAWGCYGSRFAPHFKTPHIDRIAKEGALLENCFVTNSICVPSRASILTGQYSHKNGVKTLRDSLDPKRPHVGHRLQAAGYQTALVGKWHLKTAPQGFHYWNIIKGQGRYHEPVMYEGSLANPVVQKNAYSTDIFTTHAIHWLEKRKKDKPFCLMLHFKATHEPWQFHQRHAKLFEDVVFEEPENLLGPTGPENTRIPGWPLEILTKRMSKKPNHGNGLLKLGSQDPAEIRRATYQKFVKDFLRCAVAIDENIGRVLGYLDQKELTDNTIIMYTSDQGYFMGEHNYFDKRFMLEESLRMPLVIRYPREIAGGTRIGEMVLNVDFAPTLIDYANADPLKEIQGNSFRFILKGKKPDNWRQSLYYRYWENSTARPSHFGIRTKSSKLIFYDGLTNAPKRKRWEYYNLEIDPGENVNVYHSMEKTTESVGLKSQLNAWRQALDDLE